MNRQHLGAAALFIALSVVFTWPLAPNLDRAVSDPGDPFINIWILDWDWWATFHQPLRLFHANAFHPAQYSLAYSENLYGLAVLLFPLRAAGAGATAVYNLAMLAGFALCGFTAYLLGRHLTGSFAAGMAAGIFYAFVPFRFTHLSHLQHVWGGWLPLLLLALLLYARRPSPQRAAAFAVVFLMNGLTNIHYLLFGAFAAAVTALLVVPRRDWRNLAVATGVSLLFLAPFLYPYAMVAKLYGMRSYAETLRFSAFASDWISHPAEPERRLFPGFVAMGCVVAALCWLVGSWFVRWRRDAARPGMASSVEKSDNPTTRQPDNPTTRQLHNPATQPATLLGLLWITIGFLGSLGLHFEFHNFLYGAVPGFRAVRVPARWAVIAYIGAAILAGVVTAAIARRQRWLAYVIPIAFAFELYPGPIRWWLAIPETPPVYRFLASEARTPIAELPMGGPAEYFHLFRATHHHRPMVNGISGHAPQVTMDLTAKWAALSDDFIDALAAAGVKRIVVHTEMLGTRGEETRAWLEREQNRGRLSFVRRFERDWIFAIGPGPRAPLDLWNVHGTQATTGGVDFPQGVRIRGEGYFSGWAKSPHGIRGVEIVFENGRVRHRAQLEKERFVLSLPQRPANIRRDTDFQVEILDGRGQRTRLESRWLRWD